MGNIQIQSEGELLWEGENILTQAYEIAVLRSLFGRGSTPPLYCAVGAGYAPLVDTPWKSKRLEAEMKRLRISGTFVEPLSQRSNLLTAFRAQNVNTLWRELGLFDSPELAAYGNRAATSCDSLNSSDGGGNNSSRWDTGLTPSPGNTLSTNPGLAVEGVSSISCVGEADTLFENKSIDIDTSGLFEDNVRLQMHLGISDPTLLHATNDLEIIVYTDKLAGSDFYTWKIQQADLSSGHNFIDIGFADTTSETGTPTFASLKAIRIQATSRQEGMGFSLDSIRVFQDSGTMLARAEIYPALTKTFGSTQMITWTIEPFSQL